MDSPEPNDVLIEIWAKMDACFVWAKKLLHDNIVNE